MGHLARGYKLHAIASASGQIPAWEVTPMNVAEQTVARRLIPQDHGSGYLVADHNYDANALYDLAAQQGRQLVASPDRDMLARGLGRRKQSPHRIRGFQIAISPMGRQLLRRRFGIDRMFGQLGNRGGGLSPLPNWVRHLGRVQRWVAGKLLWAAFRRNWNKGLI